MRFKAALLGLLFVFQLTASWAQAQLFPPLQTDIFVVEGTPEGRVFMDVGILVVDRTTGILYQKRTPVALNTGWVDLGAGSGGGGSGTTYNFSSQFGAVGTTNIFIASGAAITNAALTTPSLGVATATSLAIGATNVVTALATKAELTSPSFTTPSLGAATALTLDTGQGANELYDMDQNVLTGSSPSFVGMTLSGTGALQLPSGTTAQQPANNAGLVRWNTTTGRFELNIGAGGWKNLVRLDGDTMTGPLSITWTNLATTPLAGLTLSNATPATAGVTVQDSPAIYWQGNAWLTGSLSNAPIIFRAYVVPASAAATPTGILNINASANGAAFGSSFTIDQGANIGASSITAAGGSSINWNGRARMTSSADGAMEFNNNVTSARATAQFNFPQTTKTANYTNSAALDSGLRFVNIGAAGAITNFLPASVALQQYYFYVDAAQIYSIKAAGTDVIRDAATSSAAGGDIWSNAIGSTLHLFCPKAGFWVVQSKNGTWTNNP